VALHNAVATIDNNNVVEPMTSPSSWQKTRLSFAVDAVAHSFNHYGQLAEYLRMNGIVPPDSRTPEALLLLPSVLAVPETVTFPSGEITLHGVLYKPEGTGPFPAVIYNHGSAPGMMSKAAFAALGPVFASHGWVFFGPYRRGQGLSASAGPYIGDQIAAAEKAGGVSAAAATMVRLLERDHLDDQFAALAWLRKQSFVQRNRIAVAGNSFGGIETVLGVERGGR
jgi:dipeptidyl aminopeptidase/acylaminoacyl peptidase